MATADKKPEISIESDAMDAIDCFTDGMDGVVYELAEHFASVRGASEDGIVITADDIRKAAEQLGKAIKQSGIPQEVKNSVTTMLDCCSRKTQAF